VLVKLLAEGHIEILPGSDERVVAFTAASLHVRSTGGQLIDTLAKALLACPDVDELYIDDEDLRTVITELSM
jgi:hypothetical protein